ncbi:MAG TPA: DNA ligase [Clostridiales bacterium]|nr:MAG: DNA ligase [Clostridiales bacterium GWD2_32_59]HAN09349.1 DNA ligase [Clostridiales bacterium]
MDIFETKDIAPMLIFDKNQKPFNSDEFYFELKFDGIRCLAYLSDEGVELRNKRNKRVTDTYPELNSIHKQVKKRCILDGEVFVMEKGRPNFFEVQRRSLMTNKIKISLAAGRLPVCFAAYDVLYAGNEQITDRPLSERKKILSDLVNETPFLVVSRVFKKEGIALYNAAEQQGLEGIVAKKKDSKYYFGKRSKDWIKIKALIDEDFIVCGYFQKSDSIISVLIGSYSEKNIVYRGHISLGISRVDYGIMQSTSRASNLVYPEFPNFENVVWLQPVLVCNVQYMEETESGGLRQPVFKGLRDDVLPENCIYQNNIVEV